MIILNDERIPSFTKVNSISTTILPPIENNLLSIRGKAGRYNMGQSFGTREIEVEITVIADEINEVILKSRELAQWLYHKEAVKLVISDEPDKYYMVLPDGISNIEEILNIGRGTITFVCVEPFAYGSERTLNFSANETQPAFLNIEGTAETSPRFEIPIQEDLTSLAVVNEDSFVMLGDPADVQQEVVDSDPIRLSENMSNLDGWTTATSVDDGYIYGEFVSNGYSFRQRGKDYGTGAGWSGASAIRSLDRVIYDDFEVSMRVGFSSEFAKETGRIEIYLLDQNNVQFGKAGIFDQTTARNVQKFLARAGTEDKGKYFINDFGHRQDAWKNMKDGRIRIGRNGNKWWAWIGISDGRGGFHTRLQKEWIDTQETATNPLAKIQIHVGIYGNGFPYDTLHIWDVVVKERLTFTPSQAPIIAKKGDTIIIDNETAMAFRNGVPIPEMINPSSSFFNLDAGLNGIGLVPEQINVQLLYKERWL